MNKDYITFDDIKRYKRNVNGYTVSMDNMSETVEWSKPNSQWVVYATPNWDGDDGIIPFEVYNDSIDKHFEEGNLDFTKDKYKGRIELQLKLYIEAVTRTIRDLNSNAKFK